MPLYSISPACVPFIGQDGRSYYMDEQGQLIRVNFTEASSVRSWATLRPGRSHEWSEDEVTDELRLALSKLGTEGIKPPSSPPVYSSIVGNVDLSASLKTIFSLSGMPCETPDDPLQLDSGTTYVLVAAGHFRKDWFQQAEEAFVATGVPWVPLYLEGKLVRFGPLMGPYLRLEDLTIRLLSASSAPDVLQDLWAHAEKIDDTGLPFSRPEILWLGATMALLLSEWHSGLSTSSGFPPDRYQLTLNPMTREIIYHPVLRLPSAATAERMQSL